MWTLVGNQAQWKSSHLSGTVDLAHPRAGVACDDPLANARLLGVGFPDTDPLVAEPVFDAFVRGADLVVTYAQTVLRTVQPQVYWRIWDATEGFLAGCEAIVSAQTSLLDSRSGLQLLSTIPRSGEVVAVDVDGPGESPLLLVRGENAGQASVALMIEPADFAGYQLETIAAPSAGGPVSLVTANLFGESLEKGVIRRGRAAAVLLPGQDDVSRALAAFERFLRAPLPLTA